MWLTYSGILIHSTWPVLTAVFAEAAAAVVGALVAGNVARQAGTLAGLRVLTRDMLLRARAHHDAFGPGVCAEVARLFDDLEVALSVARGPRMARLMRPPCPSLVLRVEVLACGLSDRSNRWMVTRLPWGGRCPKPKARPRRHSQLSRCTCGAGRSSAPPCNSLPGSHFSLRAI